MSDPPLSELEILRSLAQAMGVMTGFTDGLGREIDVAPETLVRVCAALGAPIGSPRDAGDALAAVEARVASRWLPPVLIAWDGELDPLPASEPVEASIRLEDGARIMLEVSGTNVSTLERLPLGYHRLEVDDRTGRTGCTIISAPRRAWRRADTGRNWGVGTHLAALRSARSRSVGDLRDLERAGAWVGARGGDLVTVLPLLPTFNRDPAEPSPYSPVSRLFWSELVLDLGSEHRATPAPPSLDVRRADAEVRKALAAYGRPRPDRISDELARYARFRGVQTRLGRDWRRWPAEARAGRFERDQVDREEERFHLVAQTLLGEQLGVLERRLGAFGVRLGLDLAVGTHPDGYDPWSRQSLFAEGMSVGAPPDAGFPSGQDWGFAPVLPGASREEGHAYLAASVVHQAALAGVLRIDHIMALARLYWIPHGAGLHEGTYVRYPSDELFAILTLESHRNRCEIIGENLGTVPPTVNEALQRHRIWGMYLAEFAAMGKEPGPPTAEEVALIGTHDTPTLAGWIAQIDIDERVRTGLLDAAKAPEERQAREEGVERLADLLDCDAADLRGLLQALLEWLGRSPSPLVIPWIEDLWLESEQVNLPGTPSSMRPNWQRPMARLLDDIFADADVGALVRRLDRARRRASGLGRARTAP